MHPLHSNLTDVYSSCSPVLNAMQPSLIPWCPFQTDGSRSLPLTPQHLGHPGWELPWAGLDSPNCILAVADLTSDRLSHGHWAWALPLSLQADLGSLPDIENSLVVFCMATYGEGDPTDNAQDFYDWLQEADLDLSGVKYAVSIPPSFFPAVAPCGLVAA